MTQYRRIFITRLLGKSNLLIVFAALCPLSERLKRFILSQPGFIFSSLLRGLSAHFISFPFRLTGNSLVRLVEDAATPGADIGWCHDHDEGIILGLRGIVAD